MIMNFAIGVCIVMNGYAYRITESRKEVYLLSQYVTVFEEQREYKEFWLVSWINSHATQVKGVKATTCRN